MTRAAAVALKLHFTVNPPAHCDPLFPLSVKEHY